MELSTWECTLTSVCSVADLSCCLYSTGALTWLVTQQVNKETACGKRTIKGQKIPYPHNLLMEIVNTNVKNFLCLDKQIDFPEGSQGCVFSSSWIMSVGKPTQHPCQWSCGCWFIWCFNCRHLFTLAKLKSLELDTFFPSIANAELNAARRISWRPIQLCKKESAGKGSSLDTVNSFYWGHMMCKTQFSPAVRQASEQGLSFATAGVQVIYNCPVVSFCCSPVWCAHVDRLDPVLAVLPQSPTITIQKFPHKYFTDMYWG